MVVFIDASTPDAQHVHVGGFDLLQHGFVFGFRGLFREAVGGDEVGAFGEDRHAVHPEIKTGSLCIGFQHEFDGAQADHLLC